MDPQVLQVIIQTVGVGFVVAAVSILIYYIRKYNLEKWVQRAVRAADQLFPEDGSGPTRKEYVIKFLEENVKIPGVTPEMLDVLVEAAVNTVHESGILIETPTEE